MNYIFWGKFRNFNEYNKYIGKSKLGKILGWFFLILGILLFIGTSVTYFGWKNREKNYNKEYVYSESQLLYYEKNNERVYVDKIYNPDNEIIELNVPDKKMAVMYCDKNKPNECIFFNTSNSIEQGMLNPILLFYVIILSAAIAVFFLYKKRVNIKIKKDENGNEIYEESTSLNSIYLAYVLFFLMGVGFLGWHGYKIISYLSLKDDNNIAVATIYSEIYSTKKDNDLYKPVSYYYVNNQRYMYIDDTYEKGNLDESVGKTFEIYYDKNNPSKATKKELEINYFILICGLCFTIVPFPFIFFKKKMEYLVDKNIKDSEKRRNNSLNKEIRNDNNNQL